MGNGLLAYRSIYRQKHLLRSFMGFNFGWDCQSSFDGYFKCNWMDGTREGHQKGFQFRRFYRNRAPVYDYFDKFTFLCDMYDEDANRMLDLVLNFFPFDNSVYIGNVETRKTLLSRVQLPPLRLEMLQVGNTVSIFSKLLYLRDCAPLTKRNLFCKVESTFALIKPMPQKDLGKVITFILQKGFRITRMRNGKVSKDFVLELYRDMLGNQMLPTIINYLTSSEVIVIELVDREAVKKWRTCLGATNPAEAEPGTLRALYGESILRNVAHGCRTAEDSHKMLEMYFGCENNVPKVPFCATLKNCSCCIIKPHAIIDGNAGAILDEILTSGEFVISAIAMFEVKPMNANEFYEVYKGVLTEYEAMGIHLAEEKCIVLEVKATDPSVNVVCKFRKLCGPRDPAPVYDYFDKFTFLCDMYDEDADRMLDLVLNFFPFDNSVYIGNVETGKTLLSRVHLPTLELKMLQVGNIVTIFSKLLYLRDCAPLTKRKLFCKVESTFALIKPMPQKDLGKVITFILQKGFRITRMRNGKVSKDFVLELYRDMMGNHMLPSIIDYLTSSEVIGIELVDREAVKKWRACLGATNPAEAEPGTLRALYGESILRNVAHGCRTAEDSHKMLEMYFGCENNLPKIPYCATLKNCTCCIIKPHAIIDGNAGAILEQILNSGEFTITAIAMFEVKPMNANEFYEVYKGVLPEYEAMSIHLAEEKCIALEVKATDPSVNVVCKFRKICGPRDPDLGRQLYPNTIRALFGKNIVHNAVHCTDLAEDGEIETEYFFKILSNEID